MNFIRAGNTLASEDGRYLIERWDDHRGRTYSAWDTCAEVWECCWAYIGQFSSADDAKKACDLSRKFGGTV